MLAVVLSLLAAIGFGCSDFTAGLATRAASVIRVTIVDQAAATRWRWRSYRSRRSGA